MMSGLSGHLAEFLISLIPGCPFPFVPVLAHFFSFFSRLSLWLSADPYLLLLCPQEACLVSFAQLAELMVEASSSSLEEGYPLRPRGQILRLLLRTRPVLGLLPLYPLALLLQYCLLLRLAFPADNHKVKSNLKVTLKVLTAEWKCTRNRGDYSEH